MRAIIAVTEARSMPGRYTVSCDARRSKSGHLHPADIRGASAAAAKAMEYAVDLRGRGYAIFAPSDVISLIPHDMRSRE
jgi:hypothetical protein